MSTDRLLFSHWKQADLILATSLWGNSTVTSYISAAGSFTTDEIAERLQTEIENQSTFGIQYWPIFLKGTHTFIGCCGLRPRLSAQRTYEIGIHLLPDFWGKGFAREAIDAVIAYGFNNLEAKVLFAGHHPANEVSKKLLLSVGFTYTFDEYYTPTGLEHPSYQLLKK